MVRATEVMRLLESRIRKAMQDARVPGLALGIVQNQALVYAQGFGLTSVEDGALPVTPRTVFRIGSTTKPMTAAMIMRLVEQGRLALDWPIIEYMPDLDLTDPTATERVTLRMLLSHTSGLSNPVETTGRRWPDALEHHVREEIPTYEMLAEPGRLWVYSNSGYALAARVAEVVTGKSYSALMKDLLFQPLRLARTTLDVTVAMTYPLAQAHRVTSDGRLVVNHQFDDSPAHYAAGFVMSTVEDMARFAQMLLAGGIFRGERLLSPASVEAMQAPHVSLYQLGDRGYGLGLFVEEYKTLRMSSHPGSIGSYCSRFELFPERNTALIVLCNRATPEFPLDEILSDLRTELMDLPKQQPPPQMVEPDRSLWERFRGTYLGNWTGLISVWPEGERLMASLNGEEAPLMPLRQDLYGGNLDLTDVYLGFVPEPDNIPIKYIVANSMPARRCALPESWPLDRGSWPDYVGTYEGMAKARVRLQGDTLLIHSDFFGAEVPLTPLPDGRFSSHFGIVAFERDGMGAVTGLRWADDWLLERTDEA